MEHRVNSQSTLTRQQQQHNMTPHPAIPMHMQNEQQMFQQMKMSNGGGSPRGYNSMERSYSNTSTIPQGHGPPPSYAPFQYNSLQRGNNPMQMQQQHPQMMHQQMSMPAPTPPPPYGGTLTNAHLVNGSSSANVMMPPQLTPQQSAGSLQFVQHQPHGSIMSGGYPIEMQYNPNQPMGSQLAQQMANNQFLAANAFNSQQPGVHMVQSSTLPTGSMASVSSSHRSRSKSRSNKLMVLRVLLLDGTTPKFDLSMKSTGGEFFQRVVDHLNLLETDYFGLQYAADHAGSVYWLEMQKPICKQVKAPSSILFRFAVKFYTSEPGQLQDEYTKVLFALQIKRDMACGMLPCAENTAALMASYIVQAELGDFDVEKNSGPEATSTARYLSMFKFIPPQTDEFLVKVMEYHKNHIGQSPAEADFSLLDIARRLEMYGIRLHPARDSDEVLVHIAVNQHGISVFQHFQKSNSFSFSKIRKLSFKKKVFIVKLLTDAVSSYNQSTVEYHMTSRNACKRFWKDCIEHHAFFRLPHNAQVPKTPPVKILQSGSSFRYAGRTQKEMADQVRNTNQARLQIRRPASSMGAPMSKTLPSKSFESAGQMTPGTPGSMSGMQMVPGMNNQGMMQQQQHHPSTMPPKRMEMDAAANMAMIQQQQQQMMQQGSMQHIPTGSMQQLPGSMHGPHHSAAASITPFNRMSATSPLPQQLMAGTPLLNRSGTPLNDGQPMRPQMIPLTMSNQGINQMNQQSLQLMSPQEQQQYMHQQMGAIPQLPPHLTKHYPPPLGADTGLSGEVIQENESDHDYENYPMHSENNQQHLQSQQGSAAMMHRPPSRQRDSLTNSEGKYFADHHTSKVTAQSSSPYFPSSPGGGNPPMPPRLSFTNINNNALSSQLPNRLPPSIHDANAARSSPLQFPPQAYALSSSRGNGFVHPSNAANLSHHNSRSSLTEELRRRGATATSGSNIAYGSFENPYGENPYDFKTSYSECPYGSAPANQHRPADIMPKRHGSQELLQSRTSLPKTASRSLDTSSSALQSPVSPPALPPVMGQPISSNFQPIMSVQSYYQQNVPPALSMRGPLVSQSGIYGSNRQRTLERIEERLGQMKVNGNNTDTENGEDVRNQNGELTSSGSSLGELPANRSSTGKASSSNVSNREKRFPELPTISPSNSPHAITQFSMSNFNTLDSCTTNKFSVAASNDFSIVGDDELMERIQRRSTDTLDRGSAEINRDTVLSPSNSSHCSTPFRDRDGVAEGGGYSRHGQNSQSSRLSSRSEDHSFNAMDRVRALSNNGERHFAHEGFLNSTGYNEELNDVDDVSCASEEVFGRLNPENSPANMHNRGPPMQYYGHSSGPQSMTGFSNSGVSDRFDADSSASNVVMDYLRRSRSPGDYLSGRQGAYGAGGGGEMMYSNSKSSSFDILQQLTNVDHKESVSDEGEDEYNDDDDEDALDDDLDH